MKNKFFIALAVLALGIAITGCNSQQNDSTAPESTTDATVKIEPSDARPWVEVKQAGVWETTGDSTPPKELKNGDLLNLPIIIKTDATGLANVYFSSGSVVRIDKNSQLTIQGESTDENNNFTVALLLTAGRVWSKIWELATPQSSWEIKTSNAVAAVRCTAFCLEKIGAKSIIIGQENTILVQPLYLASSATIDSQQATIGPEKMIEIDDSIIIKLKENKLELKKLVQRAGPVIYQRDWIKRSLAEDKKLETIIKKLKAENPTRQQLNQKLKTEIIGSSATDQPTASDSTSNNSNQSNSANTANDSDASLESDNQNATSDSSDTASSDSTTNEETTDANDQSTGSNDSSVKPASTIIAQPPSVYFEHTIGISPCPQTLDSVNLSQSVPEEQSSWRIINQPAGWLTVEKTGPVPKTLPLFFNCRLAKTGAQTVSTALIFQLYNALGQPSGQTQTVNVYGTIKEQPNSSFNFYQP